MVMSRAGIRSGIPAAQAGKMRLWLTVLGTRRAAIEAGAPCRWPAPHFS
jgi:hypothetical protein